MENERKGVKMRTAVASIVCVISAPLSAQWLNYPTPGIPRLPDGRPNLAAPAPRAPDGMPDLSGLWSWCPDCPTAERLFFDLAKNLKPSEVDMTPWAAAIQAQRRDRNHVDDP